MFRKKKMGQPNDALKEEYLKKILDRVTKTHEALVALEEQSSSIARSTNRLSRYGIIAAWLAPIIAIVSLSFAFYEFREQGKREFERMDRQYAIESVNKSLLLLHETRVLFLDVVLFCNHESITLFYDQYVTISNRDASVENINAALEQHDEDFKPRIASLLKERAKHISQINKNLNQVAVLLNRLTEGTDALLHATDPFVNKYVNQLGSFEPTVLSFLLLSPVQLNLPGYDFFETRYKYGISDIGAIFKTEIFRSLLVDYLYRYLSDDWQFRAKLPVREAVDGVLAKIANLDETESYIMTDPLSPHWGCALLHHFSPKQLDGFIAQSKFLSEKNLTQ